MVTRRQAGFGLLLITFVWGGTFIWMKQALNALSLEIELYSNSAVVGILVAARFLIALILLVIFSTKARAGLREKESWKGGLILGGLMFAGFYLQMVGIESIDPSVSAFLTSLYVVMTALISVKISNKKATRTMWMGVFLATIGAGFIAGPPYLTWGIGEVVTILGAFFFALHIIFTDKITKKIEPIGLTATSFTVLIIMSLITGLFASKDGSVIKIIVAEGVVLPLILLGVFGSLVCILTLNLLQRYLDPTHAAIIYSFEPVWATFYGWGSGLVEPNWWIIMGLLLLFGNIIVELEQHHLTEEATPAKS
ncbi:MAG: DMT family transporter [Candidatus Poseidoniales archaeon]